MGLEHFHDRRKMIYIYMMIGLMLKQRKAMAVQVKLSAVQYVCKSVCFWEAQSLLLTVTQHACLSLCWAKHKSHIDVMLVPDGDNSCDSSWYLLCLQFPLSWLTLYYAGWYHRVNHHNQCHPEEDGFLSTSSKPRIRPLLRDIWLPLKVSCCIREFLLFAFVTSGLLV